MSGPEFGLERALTIREIASQASKNSRVFTGLPVEGREVYVEGLSQLLIEASEFNKFHSTPVADLLRRLDEAKEGEDMGMLSALYLKLEQFGISSVQARLGVRGTFIRASKAIVRGITGKSVNSRLARERNEVTKGQQGREFTLSKAASVDTRMTTLRLGYSIAFPSDVKIPSRKNP